MVALLQTFCFHPAVDEVLFASMEDFIYCWENSSFDAMLRSHVVSWQNLKVKRFFHFCLVYFVLFTFRASAFARYKICTTCCRDLQRINNSLRRWDHSGFLRNWLPFFLHACGRRIYYPFALVPKYNLNAFGPFAFLPARVNMHGFAWFFLKRAIHFFKWWWSRHFACVVWCIHRASL